MAIYFLSIRRNYAEMILSGSKCWEFRQNARFGEQLNVDDQIFIVSTDPKGSAVTGLCCIATILRGDAVNAWFGDKTTGHWHDAGCADGTARDWTFFAKNILGKFPVALRLAALPLESPVALAEIVHRSSGKPWRGIGLTPLEGIKNYLVAGHPADKHFSDKGNFFK